MRNVEIKAHVKDFDNICKIAEDLSGAPPKIINQDDTFYFVKEGRLKMRFYADKAATLVRYSRDDGKGPKLSNFELLEFSSAEGDKAILLDEMLKKCLGIRGRVVKERKLYLVGQTRVHIDKVENLGNFMELEVVLNPEQSVEEGQIIAKDLQTRLGVDDSDLIDTAYVDFPLETLRTYESFLISNYPQKFVKDHLSCVFKFYLQFVLINVSYVCILLFLSDYSHFKMNYPPHRTYPNKPGRRLSNNERIQRMRTETQNQQKEARMRHLREFRVNETYELQEKNTNDPIKTAKRPRTDDTEPQSKRRRIDNSDSVVPQQNGGQVNEPEPCSGVKVTIATINGFITRRDAGFVIQELGYFIELEALRGNFRLQPLFKGRPWYRQGVLHIHCENDETVMWLCSVVDRLVLWNGLTLYVKQKCQETKMIRCGIPVPDKTEAQSIKMVLRYQNLWAEVQRWIFHDVVHQKVKTFFIVSIPEDLLTKIRKNDNKLFYKLGNINVLEQGPGGKYVIKNQNNDSQFQNIVPKLEPFEINNNFFNDDVVMDEEEDFSKDPVLSRDFAYWGKVF